MTVAPHHDLYSQYWLPAYPMVWAIVLSVPGNARSLPWDKAVSSHTLCFILTACFWELASTTLHIMIFTNQELAAILKMAMTIAEADGNVSKEETTLMALELVRFGVSEEKTNVIINETSKLSTTEACVIISKMTSEEKKYVTAYLGTMICADGRIEESEIKIWSLTSAICNLPAMSLREAVEFMKNR